MNALPWARRVFSSIVTFDRSSVEIGFAVRCTVGVAIPLIAACALGHPSAGFAPAIGALIGGFTSLQGIYRSRIAVVFGVTLGIALASFLGALAAPSLPALLILTLAVGYFYGTVAQFGMPAGVAALNTAVAFIIFSSLPLTPRQDLEQSSLLFLGGMIQMMLLILAWPLDRAAIERRGLAKAYRELAGYAASLSTLAHAPPIAALATARQIVADQQPLARSRDVARYKRILAEAEALRHRLGALALLDTTDRTAPALAGLARAASDQLSALASTLDGTMNQAGLEEVRARSIEAFVAFENAFAGDAFALALARDIAAHLRDATQGVAVAATGHPVRLFLSALPRPAAYIQTKVDWFSRDAIRLAVILGVAMLLGHTVFESSRGYWIALTAALVLRPDLQGTIVRGFARVAGTVVGAVVAMLAVTASHGSPVWQSAAIVAAAAVCYLTLMPNYALFSTAMTIFVIVSLDLLGASGHTTVANRVLDTLIGGALAIAGYAAFPSWALRRTRPLLVDTIDAQRAFAVALLDAFADPLRQDGGDIAAIRTRAWKLRTEVEAAIDAARAEPSRAHTISIERSLDILAAIQSFSLVSMAVEAALETMPPGPARPEIVPFRDALDRTMREVGSALQQDRVPVVDDALEKEYRKLSAESSAGTFDAIRFIAEYGGGYVQAVSTLAQLTAG
ncbi:MAG TPA: FUSC family protein [Candidatus Acidoferrales bacterium]|jgi:uncharacterized membrane protein YccC|nr:FUSC family protein [Candidatus Acidoferrales bacterium]